MAQYAPPWRCPSPRQQFCTNAGCCRSTNATLKRHIQDGLLRLKVRYRRCPSVGHGRSCSRVPLQRDAKVMGVLVKKPIIRTPRLSVARPKPSSSYMLGRDVARPGRAMPSDQHKPHDPAILIWVPVGETPTTHAFAASSASTFRFLPDAVIHAQKEAAHRPEKPWITTSNVLFGPGQIRVLFATVTAKGAS